MSDENITVPDGEYYNQEFDEKPKTEYHYAVAVDAYIRFENTGVVKRVDDLTYCKTREEARTIAAMKVQQGCSNVYVIPLTEEAGA